eukprot:scaffold26612_cov56-Attheya_sp.AAC.5
MVSQSIQTNVNGPSKKRIGLGIGQHQQMQIPQMQKQIRSLIGSINLYQHMWLRQAHVLMPLVLLQGKKEIQWTDVHTKQVFNVMKAFLMKKDCLLSYPDPNIPYEINTYDIKTDASDYQMGAIIKQNCRPVAFFSRKLHDA